MNKIKNYSWRSHQEYICNTLSINAVILQAQKGHTCVESYNPVIDLEKHTFQHWRTSWPFLQRILQYIRILQYSHDGSLRLLSLVRVFGLKGYLVIALAAVSLSKKMLTLRMRYSTTTACDPKCCNVQLLSSIFSFLMRFGAQTMDRFFACIPVSFS